MSHPMPLTRLDEVGRRLLPLIKYGPYVLLGFLVIFTVAARYASGTSLAIDVALCGLAAAWMLWMFTLHPHSSGKQREHSQQRPAHHLLPPVAVLGH